MYIRKATRKYKSKTYTNYLLVESVQTPSGPRQRTVCSLGSMAPGPAEQWQDLAHKLESALRGQGVLEEQTPEVKTWIEKAREKAGPSAAVASLREAARIDIDNIEVEQAREAGSVHVGHQLWGQLGLPKFCARQDFPKEPAS